MQFREFSGLNLTYNAAWRSNNPNLMSQGNNIPNSFKIGQFTCQFVCVSVRACARECALLRVYTYTHVAKAQPTTKHIYQQTKMEKIKERSKS